VARTTQYAGAKTDLLRNVRVSRIGVEGGDVNWWFYDDWCFGWLWLGLATAVQQADQEQKSTDENE